MRLRENHDLEVINLQLILGGVIMARIAGVDLPREKRVEVGITYIYGIGSSSAKKILAEAPSRSVPPLLISSL